MHLFGLTFVLFLQFVSLSLFCLFFCQPGLPFKFKLMAGKVRLVLATHLQNEANVTKHLENEN